MKYLFTLLFFTVLVALPLYAQKDTVNVPDLYDAGGLEGTLNTTVQPYIDNNTVSNTVFKLKPYGYYVLSGTITTKAGQVLEIDADPPGITQATAPPMIIWTENTSPDKTYLLDIPGQLIMNNIWICWSGVNGTRFASTIRIGDSASVSGGVIRANNVLFDYVDQASSGAVMPYATHFKGFFTNCYFRNCTDQHFRYYSRAVSFAYATTGLGSDSVSFENCTFANIGYVYMQEGAEYADNVFFNHCTFYNVNMFVLESGWWHRMYVTNSLFVNTYMLGKVPSSDGDGNGGTITIAPIDTSIIDGSTQNGFGFSVPFKEQDRHILFMNNAYSIDQWLINWMYNNPYSQGLHKQRHDTDIPVPQPIINNITQKFFDSVDVSGNKVFPLMNMGNIDSVFSPGFVLPPINQDSLMQFLYHKWYDNGDVAWPWHPEHAWHQLWPDSESLAYTNDTLTTAAMGKFPLGDLYHWWPTQYTQWAAQANSEHATITNWLETGQQGGNAVTEKGSLIPAVYSLNQNYPNPFNPATTIEFSVPKSGFVTLKVYNILGQEVATIFEGLQKAGSYKVDFNAASLASGIYIYRLESGNVSISKKLVLMK